jgi:hypothetical protein
VSDVNKIASKFLNDYLRGVPVEKVEHISVKKPKMSCYDETAEEFLNRMRKEFERTTAPQELSERVDIDELQTGSILMHGPRAFVGFLGGARRPVFTHDFKLAKVFTTEVDISFAQIELLTYGIGAERRPSITEDTP